MEPGSMVAHGLALRSFFDGDAETQLLIRRDDGLEVPLPVSVFFRSPDEFRPIEAMALERCRGHVLDIGAGSGLHSLFLQSEGLTVTALDIDPEAADIMTTRGVADVRCSDVLDFDGGPFDTLLMLGHGIGIVGDLPGLQRFLSRARRLTREDGQVLADSLDVRRSADPQHVAYHEANRKAGRYEGETRIQFEYGGCVGPYCAWLHVDPVTLAQCAALAGFKCEVLLEEDSGEYLARLVPGPIR
jgi:SAM-dependent methyltransferase